MRRTLQIGLIASGALLYLWFAAVHHAREAKERKAARAGGGQ